MITHALSEFLQSNYVICHYFIHCLLWSSCCKGSPVAEFSWHALQHLSTSPRVIHSGQTVYCKISCISLQRREPRHIKSLVTHAFWQTVCRSGLSWSHFMTSLSLPEGHAVQPCIWRGFIIKGVVGRAGKPEQGLVRSAIGLSLLPCPHIHSHQLWKNCSFSCLWAAFRHGPCFLFN